MDTQTDELILGILRAESDGRCKEYLESLSEENWGGIIRQSLRHCIAPLLYHRLMTNFRGVCVPDGVMSRLKVVNLYCTARNIRFYHEIDRLLKSLGDSVPVLLLKGVHLAAFVYRDISLRSMVDLDILVRKADLHVVARTMRKLGYTRSMEDPDHPFHVAYMDSTKTVNLEIHWDICSEPAPPTVLDIEELWRDSRLEVLKGNQIRVLRPEHLLLHICLHDAVQHSYFFGLKTFCDIDAIIRRYREEIDWDMVVSCARQWSITKSSYLTLLLARELMDVNVPERVLAALKPRDFEPQNLSWARKAIFSPLSQDEPVSGSFAEFWGADRYKHKMAILLENIFPPRDYMAKTYSVPSNAPRILLYYPWRLIEFWMRYGRSLCKMWNPESEVHTGLEAEHSRILLRQWLQR